MCAGNAGKYGGVNAPCSLFARYMPSLDFWRCVRSAKVSSGASCSSESATSFGKTIPQTLYTWSSDAIGIKHSWGLGVYLAKGFELRVTQHFLFDRLGARDRNLGPADLGNNGPWGRYNTIGVRNILAREDGRGAVMGDLDSSE